MNNLNYNKINRDIEKINKNINNEFSEERITNLIKKRDELLSGYVQIDTLPCNNIQLPLKIEYGGTGLTNAVFPVSYGGTGISSILNNSILIGRGEIIENKIINGSLIDTDSHQTIINKMFDDIKLLNFDLEKSVKGVLSKSKGGTGYSSLLCNSIVGFPDIKLNENVFFSLYKTTTQLLDNNETIINKWKSLYNSNNYFNIDTGIFTIPFDGNYIFTWSLLLKTEDINNNDDSVIIKLITQNKTFKTIEVIDKLLTVSGTFQIKLNKNDMVYLVGYTSNKNITCTIPENSNNVWFTGLLLSMDFRF